MIGKPANRDLLVSLLELKGLTVESAASGAEGLEVADSFQPDVVIVDLGLPIMDGYSVAQRLRESHGDLIVLIALTGYGQPSDVQRALQSGFDHHLVKPLQIDALCRLLRIDKTQEATR